MLGKDLYVYIPHTKNIYTLIICAASSFAYKFIKFLTKLYEQKHSYVSIEIMPYLKKSEQSIEISFLKFEASRFQRHFSLGSNCYTFARDNLGDFCTCDFESHLKLYFIPNYCSLIKKPRNQLKYIICVIVQSLYLLIQKRILLISTAKKEKIG